MKAAARILSIAILSATAAAPATAAGFYGAVDLGNTHANDVCTAANVVGCNSSAGALRVTGGYQFLPNWAGELSYANYGTASRGITAGGAPRGDWSATGLQISAVASLPVNAQFSLFTKVGIGFNTYTAGNISATNNTITGGFGVRYDLSSKFAIRGQYENLGSFGDRAVTGLTRVSLLSVGGLMNF